MKEKRSHEFDREQVRIYERVWRDEREGANDVILQSQQLMCVRVV